MSTRSATNKRTQNHEYTGMTRKGATSAKPARPAATSVRVVPASSKARRREAERGESLEGLSKEERRARKRELRAREDRQASVANAMLREDDDYKSRRRIFWVILVIGVVVLIAEGAILAGMDAGIDPQLYNTIQIAGIVLAYAFVIGAFVYDMVRIRPLRNYYRGRAEGMTDARAIAFLEEVSRRENPRGRHKKKASADDGASTDAATQKSDEVPAAAPAAKKRGPKKNNRSRR